MLASRSSREKPSSRHSRVRTSSPSSTSIGRPIRPSSSFSRMAIVVLPAPESPVSQTTKPLRSVIWLSARSLIRSHMPHSFAPYENHAYEGNRTVVPTCWAPALRELGFCGYRPEGVGLSKHNQHNRSHHVAAEQEFHVLAVRVAAIGGIVVEPVMEMVT